MAPLPFAVGVWRGDCCSHPLRSPQRVPSPACGAGSGSGAAADPAVVTGTFLLGVLRRIVQTVQKDQGAGAVRGAIEAAMKRIVGFEMQFGPYAVARLRLIAELQALMGKAPLSELRP